MATTSDRHIPEGETSRFRRLKNSMETGDDGIMITGELKSKVDQIWNTMWSGGISKPRSRSSSNSRTCCSSRGSTSCIRYERRLLARLDQRIIDWRTELEAMQELKD